MSVLGWLVVLLVWSVVASAGLVLSLAVTNPSAIGPLGVTIWFVVVYWDLAAIATLVFFGLKAFLHVHATGYARLRYSWRQGLLVGGWLTGMLALSSLHQFGLRDGILLALLLAIVEVYVRFRWP